MDTYPCEKDEHRQSEMGSENDGEVNRGVPDDRPDDSRKPEVLPLGRQLIFVSGCDDGEESTGIECQG